MLMKNISLFLTHHLYLICIVLSIFQIIILTEPLIIDPYPAKAEFRLPDTHRDIDHSKVIQKNNNYISTISPESFHYYYLLGREKSSDIQLMIQAKEKISLSFQFYDHKGNLTTPASYTIDTANCRLIIEYKIAAEKNCLFGIYNSKKEPFTYSISYSYKEKQSASSTKKPNVKQQKKKHTNKKPIRSAKPITTKKPLPKKTSKNKINNHTTSSVISSQKPIFTETPKKNTSNIKSKIYRKKSKKTTIRKSNKEIKNNANKTATKNLNKAIKNNSSKATTKKYKKSNMKNKNTIKKLYLSETFLQIKKGDSISLTASAITTDTCKFYWDYSGKFKLKNKKIKNSAGKSTLSGIVDHPGIYTVTCRLKDTVNVSASCTVKII